MKQVISNYGTLFPLARHHMVPQGIAGACASAGNTSFYHDKCAVPSTLRTRQNGFKDDPYMESAMRKLTARLHIKGNFDVFGPDPAVAYAYFADKLGEAGLAGFMHTAETLRSRMSPEISV
ncbi:hypothetical protein [Aliiroseovarius sp. PrR006]|uniref:hypothetical protein n=1 Tax=Aliiroseovarius sp. PrR006 TaxID=2706883 RepID=UPI0013D3F9D5|nr:hypothetical protein [Aliiroseovarius sp. PrR006]NDW54530.1 hypothetical protein [Aliiroseovarius sp. PrR006]